MPSHRWFSQPAALDAAVGAGAIAGNTPTGAAPSDFRSVHTDSAPVHTPFVAGHTDSALVHTNFAPVSLITLFGHGGTPMSTPEPSGASPARKAGVPRRLAFILAPFLLLVAHGVLPWAISLLGPWHGWTDGSPAV